MRVELKPIMESIGREFNRQRKYCRNKESKTCCCCSCCCLIFNNNKPTRCCCWCSMSVENFVLKKWRKLVFITFAAAALLNACYNSGLDDALPALV